MKKLITIGAALGLIAFAAQAQNRYASQTVFSTTAGITNSTANAALTGVLDVRKQSNVAIQTDAYNDNTSAVTFTIAYSKSVDGATYGPISGTNVIHTGVTKTANTIVLPTEGCGWMKINYVTNSHATISCTNFALRYAIKY